MAGSLAPHENDVPYILAILFLAFSLGWYLMLSHRALGFLFTKLLSKFVLPDNVHFSVKSVELALLNGRIFFGGVRYFSRNSSWQLTDGYVSFKWWEHEGAKVHVHLNGSKWTLYNNVSKYEDFAEYVNKRKHPGTASAGGARGAPSSPKASHGEAAAGGIAYQGLFEDESTRCMDPQYKEQYPPNALGEDGKPEEKSLRLYQRVMGFIKHVEIDVREGTIALGTPCQKYPYFWHIAFKRMGGKHLLDEKNCLPDDLFRVVLDSTFCDMSIRLVKLNCHNKDKRHSTAHAGATAANAAAAGATDADDDGKAKAAAAAEVVEAPQKPPPPRARTASASTAAAVSALDATSPLPTHYKRGGTDSPVGAGGGAASRKGSAASVKGLGLIVQGAKELAMGMKFVLWDREEDDDDDMGGNLMGADAAAMRSFICQSEPEQLMQTFGTVIDKNQRATMRVLYYQDMPGVEMKAGERRTTSDLPKMGLHIDISADTVRYGALINLMRQRIHLLFFPWDYRIWGQYRPRNGDWRTTGEFEQVITFVKDCAIVIPWRQKKEGLGPPRGISYSGHDREMTILTDKGSQFVMKYPYVQQSATEGVLSEIYMQLIRPRIVTSMNKAEFFRAEEMGIHIDAQYAPFYVFNEHSTWDYIVNIKQGQTYYLAEHAQYFQDFLEDWSNPGCMYLGEPFREAWSGSRDFFMKEFAPYTQTFEVFFNGMDIKLNANDNNVIYCHASDQENSIVTVRCGEGSMRFVSPNDVFTVSAASEYRMRYEACVDGIAVLLSLPPQHEVLDALGKCDITFVSEVFATVDTIKVSGTTSSAWPDTHEAQGRTSWMPRRDPPQEWADNFVRKPTVDNTLSLCDVSSAEFHVDGLTAALQGWHLRHLGNLANNYGGADCSFVSPQTFSRFADSAAGFPDGRNVRYSFHEHVVSKADNPWKTKESTASLKLTSCQIYFPLLPGSIEVFQAEAYVDSDRGAQFHDTQAGPHSSVIPKGELIVLLGTKEEWARCRFGGQLGWVRLVHLRPRQTTGRNRVVSLPGDGLSYHPKKVRPDAEYADAGDAVEVCFHELGVEVTSLPHCTDMSVNMSPVTIRAPVAAQCDKRSHGPEHFIGIDSVLCNTSSLYGPPPHLQCFLTRQTVNVGKVSGNLLISQVALLEEVGDMLLKHMAMRDRSLQLQIDAAKAISAADEAAPPTATALGAGAEKGRDERRRNAWAPSPRKDLFDEGVKWYSEHDIPEFKVWLESREKRVKEALAKAYVTRKAAVVSVSLLLRLDLGYVALTLNKGLSGADTTLCDRFTTLRGCVLLPQFKVGLMHAKASSYQRETDGDFLEVGKLSGACKVRYTEAARNTVESTSGSDESQRTFLQQFCLQRWGLKGVMDGGDRHHLETEHGHYTQYGMMHATGSFHHGHKLRRSGSAHLNPADAVSTPVQTQAHPPLPKKGLLDVGPAIDASSTFEVSPLSSFGGVLAAAPPPPPPHAEAVASLAAAAAAADAEAAADGASRRSGEVTVRLSTDGDELFGGDMSTEGSTESLVNHGAASEGGGGGGGGEFRSPESGVAAGSAAHVDPLASVGTPTGSGGSRSVPAAHHADEDISEMPTSAPSSPRSSANQLYSSMHDCSDGSPVAAAAEAEIMPTPGGSPGDDSALIDTINGMFQSTHHSMNSVQLSMESMQPSMESADRAQDSSVGGRRASFGSRGRSASVGSGGTAGRLSNPLARSNSFMQGLETCISNYSDPDGSSDDSPGSAGGGGRREQSNSASAVLPRFCADDYERSPLDRSGTFRYEPRLDSTMSSSEGFGRRRSLSVPNLLPHNPFERLEGMRLNERVAPPASLTQFSDRGRPGWGSLRSDASEREASAAAAAVSGAASRGDKAAAAAAAASGRRRAASEGYAGSLRSAKLHQFRGVPHDSALLYGKGHLRGDPVFAYAKHPKVCFEPRGPDTAENTLFPPAGAAGQDPASSRQLLLPSQSVDTNENQRENTSTHHTFLSFLQPLHCLVTQKAACLVIHGTALHTLWKQDIKCRNGYAPPTPPLPSERKSTAPAAPVSSPLLSALNNGFAPPPNPLMGPGAAAGAVPISPLYPAAGGGGGGGGGGFGAAEPRAAARTTAENGRLRSLSRKFSQKRKNTAAASKQNVMGKKETILSMQLEECVVVCALGLSESVVVDEEALEGVLDEIPHTVRFVVRHVKVTQSVRSAGLYVTTTSRPPAVSRSLSIGEAGLSLNRSCPHGDWGSRGGVRLPPAMSAEMRAALQLSEHSVLAVGCVMGAPGKPAVLFRARCEEVPPAFAPVHKAVVSVAAVHVEFGEDILLVSSAMYQIYWIKLLWQESQDDSPALDEELADDSPDALHTPLGPPGGTDCASPECMSYVFIDSVSHASLSPGFGRNGATPLSNNRGGANGGDAQSLPRLKRVRSQVRRVLFGATESVTAALKRRAAQRQRQRDLRRPAKPAPVAVPAAACAAGGLPFAGAASASCSRGTPRHFNGHGTSSGQLSSKGGDDASIVATEHQYTESFEMIDPPRMIEEMARRDSAISLTGTGKQSGRLKFDRSGEQQTPPRDGAAVTTAPDAPVQSLPTMPILSGSQQSPRTGLSTLPMSLDRSMTVCAPPPVTGEAADHSAQLQEVENLCASTESQPQRFVQPVLGRQSPDSTEGSNSGGKSHDPQGVGCPSPTNGVPCATDNAEEDPEDEECATLKWISECVAVHLSVSIDDVIVGICSPQPLASERLDDEAFRPLTTSGFTVRRVSLRLLGNDRQHRAKSASAAAAAAADGDGVAADAAAAAAFAQQQQVGDGGTTEVPITVIASVGSAAGELDPSMLQLFIKANESASGESTPRRNGTAPPYDTMPPSASCGVGGGGGGGCGGETLGPTSSAGYAGNVGDSCVGSVPPTPRGGGVVRRRARFVPRLYASLVVTRVDLKLLYNLSNYLSFSFHNSKVSLTNRAQLPSACTAGANAAAAASCEKKPGHKRQHSDSEGEGSRSANLNRTGTSFKSAGARSIDLDHDVAATLGENANVNTSRSHAAPQHPGHRHRPSDENLGGPARSPRKDGTRAGWSDAAACGNFNPEWVLSVSLSPPKPHGSGGGGGAPPSASSPPSGRQARQQRRSGGGGGGGRPAPSISLSYHCRPLLDTGELHGECKEIFRFSVQSLGVVGVLPREPFSPSAGVVSAHVSLDGVLMRITSHEWLVTEHCLREWQTLLMRWRSMLFRRPPRPVEEDTYPGSPRAPHRAPPTSRASQAQDTGNCGGGGRGGGGNSGGLRISATLELSRVECIVPLTEDACFTYALRRLMASYAKGLVTGKGKEGSAVIKAQIYSSVIKAAGQREALLPSARMIYVEGPPSSLQCYVDKVDVVLTQDIVNAWIQVYTVITPQVMRWVEGKVASKSRVVHEAEPPASTPIQRAVVVWAGFRVSLMAGATELVANSGLGLLAHQEEPPADRRDAGKGGVGADLMATALFSRSFSEINLTETVYVPDSFPHSSSSPLPQIITTSSPADPSPQQSSRVGGGGPAAAADSAQATASSVERRSRWYARMPKLGVSLQDTFEHRRRASGGTGGVPNVEPTHHQLSARRGSALSAMKKVSGAGGGGGGVGGGAGGDGGGGGDGDGGAEVLPSFTWASANFSFYAGNVDVERLAQQDEEAAERAAAGGAGQPAGKPAAAAAASSSVQGGRKASVDVTASSVSRSLGLLRRAQRLDGVRPLKPVGGGGPGGRTASSMLGATAGGNALSSFSILARAGEAETAAAASASASTHPVHPPTLSSSDESPDKVHLLVANTTAVLRAGATEQAGALQQAFTLSFADFQTRIEKDRRRLMEGETLRRLKKEGRKWIRRTAETVERARDPAIYITSMVGSFVVRNTSVTVPFGDKAYVTCRGVETHGVDGLLPDDENEAAHGVDSPLAAPCLNEIWRSASGRFLPSQALQVHLGEASIATMVGQDDTQEGISEQPKKVIVLCRARDAHAYFSDGTQLPSWFRDGEARIDPRQKWHRDFGPRFTHVVGGRGVFLPPVKELALPSAKQRTRCCVKDITVRARGRVWQEAVDPLEITCDISGPEVRIAPNILSCLSDLAADFEGIPATAAQATSSNLNRSFGTAAGTETSYTGTPSMAPTFRSSEKLEPQRVSINADLTVKLEAGTITVHSDECVPETFQHQNDDKADAASAASATPPASADKEATKHGRDDEGTVVFRLPTPYVSLRGNAKVPTEAEHESGINMAVTVSATASFPADTIELHPTSVYFIHEMALWQRSWPGRKAAWKDDIDSNIEGLRVGLRDGFHAAQISACKVSGSPLTVYRRPVVRQRGDTKVETLEVFVNHLELIDVLVPVPHGFVASIGCDADCTAVHTTNCMRCGLPFAAHTDHMCSFMERGLFLPPTAQQQQAEAAATLRSTEPGGTGGTGGTDKMSIPFNAEQFAFGHAASLMVGIPRDLASTAGFSTRDGSHAADTQIHSGAVRTVTLRTNFEPVRMCTVRVEDAAGAPTGREMDKICKEMLDISRCWELLIRDPRTRRRVRLVHDDVCDGDLYVVDIIGSRIVASLRIRPFVFAATTAPISDCQAVLETGTIEITMIRTPAGQGEACCFLVSTLPLLASGCAFRAMVKDRLHECMSASVSSLNAFVSPGHPHRICFHFASAGSRASSEAVRCTARLGHLRSFFVVYKLWKKKSDEAKAELVRVERLAGERDTPTPQQSVPSSCCSQLREDWQAQKAAADASQKRSHLIVARVESILFDVDNFRLNHTDSNNDKFQLVAEELSVILADRKPRQTRDPRGYAKVTGRSAPTNSDAADVDRGTVQSTPRSSVTGASYRSERYPQHLHHTKVLRPSKSPAEIRTFEVGVKLITFESQGRVSSPSTTKTGDYLIVKARQLLNAHKLRCRDESSATALQIISMDVPPLEIDLREMYKPLLKLRLTNKGVSGKPASTIRITDNYRPLSRPSGSSPLQGYQVDLAVHIEGIDIDVRPTLFPKIQQVSEEVKRTTMLQELEADKTLRTKATKKAWSSLRPQAAAAMLRSTQPGSSAARQMKENFLNIRSSYRATRGGGGGGSGALGGGVSGDALSRSRRSRRSRGGDAPLVSATEEDEEEEDEADQGRVIPRGLVHLNIGNFALSLGHGATHVNASIALRTKHFKCEMAQNLQRVEQRYLWDLLGTTVGKGLMSQPLYTRALAAQGTPLQQSGTVGRVDRIVKDLVVTSWRVSRQTGDVEQPLLRGDRDSLFSMHTNQYVGSNVVEFDFWSQFQQPWSVGRTQEFIALRDWVDSFMKEARSGQPQQQPPHAGGDAAASAAAALRMSRRSPSGGPMQHTTARQRAARGGKDAPAASRRQSGMSQPVLGPRASQHLDPSAAEEYSGEVDSARSGSEGVKRKTSATSAAAPPEERVFIATEGGFEFSPVLQVVGESTLPISALLSPVGLDESVVPAGLHQYLGDALVSVMSVLYTSLAPPHVLRTNRRLVAEFQQSHDSIVKAYQEAAAEEERNVAPQH